MANIITYQNPPTPDVLLDSQLVDNTTTPATRRETVTLGDPATKANIAAVTADGGLTTVQAPLTTATLANVASSITSVTLLALNAARRVATFFNDSTANLFLKFGATASATSFTVKLAAGAYYELPQPVYTGIIDGIWDAANGAVRVTEVSA
jgi:hypothetical protein